MSHALEQREAIIKSCIPELIKTLTGFDDTEENFTLCQQFALQTIRNHRFLSVNSHEIRRKADGFAQNLRISNMERHAETFLQLFEGFIAEPECADHYVHDIQWSVLLFLMKVAHNPVGALRERIRRGYPIAMIEATVEEIPPVADDHREEILEDLKADNIAIDEDGGDDDSDLSEWSDSVDEDNVLKEEVSANVSEENVTQTKEVVVYTRVESPKRDLGYERFDGSESEKWLKENIQSRWWVDPKARAEVNSTHEGASFCDYWSQTILKASNSFIKLDPVSTVSEYCLVREILWMFTNPTDCKFFRIDDDQIWINPNVSLSSATERGLHTFLINFTEHMTIVFRLRNFCNRVSESSSKPIPAPYSFECYSAGVRDFLDHLGATIVELEKKAIAQEPDCIFTIITLFHELEPEFNVLKNLYDIHRFSVLDWTKFPAHIAVAHLISGLFRGVKLSGHLEKTNLAFALLLSTLKGYMNIIDIWWTEGRLDDWREEFLVEKTYAENGNTVTGYRARLFSKCKKRSFYVSSAVSEVIENDAIIKLLMHHSLEAGYTLNILCGLDRISDLRSGSESDENMMYLGFLEVIMEVLDGFKTAENSTEDLVDGDKKLAEDMSKNMAKTMKLQNLRNQIKEICDDELLMMALDSSLQLACEEDDDDGKVDTSEELSKNPLINAHLLYGRLNSISNYLMLPLEHVLFDAIKNLMESKRQAANHFVSTIYKEELLVLNHLQNIRRVLLLEASDLMYFFYSDLFKMIEAGEHWANPYLLTIQLNDILASRFSDMTSLFTIEIIARNKSETTTVLEAIDMLQICYSPCNDLSNMINEKTMSIYNNVFRFLLKVKWALGKLESLRFPECYKKKRPYEDLCILDLNLKRLSMLKFWMIFSVQCVHSHLMTHVLQSLGMHLDRKMQAADNLNEMIADHQSYISAIHEQCFQTDEGKVFREGVIRLLNLVQIMSDEWINNVLYTDMDARGDIEDNSMIGDFISNAQVSMLEKTYCKCHQQLAELLNREVYAKHKSHLAALADAFSYNVPY
ncbi:gamma-tubulin complex component 5 [Toxorhynchites rutilus septentrionalis]|uniref:gamma-tubulin complex component 5 n=1 Tax=Toxorhynchites rutilus septentrionalis TaxID=329112 RepID=UPI0024789505|nr:gamma-tubulin complex component 5 [Toxorhynchites rutilus septentrionalis]